MMAILSIRPVDTTPYTAAFTRLCRASSVYQGHGWGYARFTANGWRAHHSIQPIWNDSPARIGNTRLLIMHARSAFRDADIRVENNMPFIHEQMAFAFNGELSGVRIREQGRIGAEKLFNVSRRFRQLPLQEAVSKTVRIMKRNTRHIRGMNMMLSDGRHLVLSSCFTENPDYYTVHFRRKPDMAVICSEPLDNGPWETLERDRIIEFTATEHHLNRRETCL